MKLKMMFCHLTSGGGETERELVKDIKLVKR